MLLSDSHDRGRPPAKEAAPNVTDGDSSSVERPAYTVRDLDSWAEALSGRFVVQVVVNADSDFRRTFVYRSCAAAERCVDRARERGQTAHVSLVRMLPVGVVAGVIR